MRLLYLVSGDLGDLGDLISVASVSEKKVAESLVDNSGYCELKGEVIEPIECYRAVNGELKLKDNWQQIKESLNEYEVPINDVDKNDTE